MCQLSFEQTAELSGIRSWKQAGWLRSGKHLTPQAFDFQGLLDQESCTVSLLRSLVLRSSGFECLDLDACYLLSQVFLVLRFVKA